MLKKPYILWILGCLGIGMCIAIGFVIGQLSYQPKEVEIERPKVEYITVENTVYETIYKTIEVPVPTYITVTKEKFVEVPTTIYRNISPKRWESVEQFVKWYKTLDFKLTFYSTLPDSVDCDDYAVWLQVEALKQGYSVSQAIVYGTKYGGVKVVDSINPHAGNLVLIDNSYYYVEPHPDKFKIVKIIDRD